MVQPPAPGAEMSLNGAYTQDTPLPNGALLGLSMKNRFGYDDGLESVRPQRFF